MYSETFLQDFKCRLCQPSVTHFLARGRLPERERRGLHFLASPLACCWAVGMLHDTFPPPGGAQELPSQRNMKPNHHWVKVKLAEVSRCTLFVQVFFTASQLFEGCYNVLWDFIRQAWDLLLFPFLGGGKVNNKYIMYFNLFNSCNLPRFTN